jgi:hypothetical protein
MQIHELSEAVRPPAPAPVQGLDTTKVSPFIAAQIAKAEADSQARLSQQAKQAAPPAADVPAQTQPTTAMPPRRSTSAPSLLSRTKALGSATAAGYKKGGLLGALKSNLSWDQYDAELDKITNPTASAVPATLISKLAPTGMTQKSLAAAGQVLQQLGNGNKRIKKTGDQNVDALLTSMGYTLQ